MGTDYIVEMFKAFKVDEDNLDEKDEAVLESYLEEKTKTYYTVIERTEDYFALNGSRLEVMSGRLNDFIKVTTRLGKTTETYPKTYTKEITEETYCSLANKKITFNNKVYGKYDGVKELIKEYMPNDKEKEMLKKLSFEPKMVYIEHAYIDR